MPARHAAQVEGAVTIAATLAQTQETLRSVMSARRAAELRLQSCKTTTSPAAKQHQAEIAAQDTFAASLRQSIQVLSRQPEAATLAARFGDRPLYKYIPLHTSGREVLDILRMNEIRIAFFTIAVSADVTELEPMCYWFDMADGSGHVGLEVK